MTAPAAGGRDDATIRGAVVLVVAIVIGLALLARGGGGGGDDEDASSDRTTTTTEATGATGADGSTSSLPAPVNDTSTTTGPVATADPASITVAVLNATATVGLAGDKAALLEAAQYMTVTGNFSGSNADTTMIYATPEAQADANAIKTLLDLGGAVVAEKGEALGKNGEDADAQVVVVLGADSTTAGGATDSTDPADTTDTTAGE